MKLKAKLKPSMLLTALASIVFLPATQANEYLFPYNEGSNIAFDQGDLERSYEAWKGARITSNNAGGNGRFRVMGGVTDNTTVSEGMAYGMILTSLFDDQTEFDGLWLFTKDHFDNQNLMHWYIGNPGQLLGTGAATDAEVDMAIALINACVKTEQGVWPQSNRGIDYCADANDIIENIYRYEVDQPGPEPFGGMNNNFGDELMPGDQWDLQNNYPNGVVNLSYFPPGFFRVFGKFTGQEQKWQDVIDRNYSLVDEVQAKPGNCSGLVPNWNQYNGDVQVVAWQPQNSGWWSWDAARFGWRIAIDALWYGEPDAMETVNEVGSFFASVGMNNLGGEYQMNGQSASGANVFFTSNAAATIYAANNLQGVSCGDATGAIQSSAQDAYDRTRGSGYAPTDYYAAYWRLINMMLITGNFPNFYELANSGTGDSDPSVSITSPSDGGVIQPGAAVTISANASDDGSVSQVSFFVDGALVGSDSSEPYSVTLNNLSSGSHAIYAEATDNENNTASSSSVSILVGSQNQAPTASFTSSADYLDASFDAGNSSDPDGSIQSYEWQFGDGSTGAGSNVTHSFAAAGSYEVSLTVTDNDGASSTQTESISVSAEPNTGGSSSCEYVVMNEWNSGFVAEIRITNNGSSNIQGWNISWSYAGGDRMASGWNANYSGNNPYSASPFGWNSTIAPGQTVAIGFQGTKGSSSAEVPSVSGEVCD